MNAIVPLVRIPVGVVVERCKANSPWSEFTWRPTAVLGGPIIAQLADHKLAHGVIEVSRIEGPAIGLLVRVASVDVSLFPEQFN